MYIEPIEGRRQGAFRQVAPKKRPLAAHTSFTNVQTQARTHVRYTLLHNHIDPPERKANQLLNVECCSVIALLRFVYHTLPILMRADPKREDCTYIGVDLEPK